MQSHSKVCRVCGVTKPIFDYDSTPHGYRGMCKPCKRKQWRDWSVTRPALDAKRAYQMYLKYGLSEHDYEVMLILQEGRCAICNREEWRLHRSGVLLNLSVDHDHETGEIRALLCSGCNVGLGSFAEDADRLRAAAAYIDSFRS